jgi:hypothetical protein
VREDFALDLADPDGRMAMSYLNVVAIAEDGSLVFGSTRAGVRAALAAAAGQEPSFADALPVAPILRAAPPDLVSALVLGGEVLRATPDPAGALLGEESPQDFATRVARRSWRKHSGCQWSLPRCWARRREFLPPATTQPLARPRSLSPGSSSA